MLSMDDFGKALAPMLRGNLVPVHRVLALSFVVFLRHLLVRLPVHLGCKHSLLKS